MADVDAAVQFVLRQEDSRLSGAVTTLPGDSGGPTRFGLASTRHPELVAQQYYEVVEGVPVVPHEVALPIAEAAYTTQYAAPVQLAAVTNQDIANRILSFSINEGPGTATEVLQRALNSLGNTLTIDGGFGSKTLAAVNAADPEMLLAAERTFEEQYYDQLVIKEPALAPYIKGLLARADA